MILVKKVVQNRFGYLDAWCASGSRKYIRDSYKIGLVLEKPYCM